MAVWQTFGPKVAFYQQSKGSVSKILGFMKARSANPHLVQLDWDLHAYWRKWRYPLSQRGCTMHGPLPLASASDAQRVTLPRILQRWKGMIPREQGGRLTCELLSSCACGTPL